MAIKPLNSFSNQDIVNAVNTLFGNHPKYKIFIDFVSHISDTNDEAINNFVSNAEAFQEGSNMLEIPVLPEKLGINNEADTETVNILGLGEVNLLKGTHLKTIELESFFPSTYQTLTISNNLTKIKNIMSFLPNSEIPDTSKFSENANMIEGLYRMAKKEVPPYVNTQFLTMDQHQFKDKFISAVENNTVVKFIVTGLNINILCTIENFDWHGAYGSDDIYYKMTLKEYKKFKYHKVGEKATEYCAGDTVRYKKTSSSKESEGKIEQVEVRNGVKMYKVRDTGMLDSATFDASSFDGAFKDINKYTSMDGWITKDKILCKAGEKKWNTSLKQ